MRPTQLFKIKKIWKLNNKYEPFLRIFSPDDASVKEREDEIESDWAPRHKMVHPGPELSLQGKLEK